MADDDIDTGEDTGAEDTAKVTNADGSVTYTLSCPVTSEGEEIDKVTLRRCLPVDLADADAVKGGDTARNIFLIARLGNIPQAVVRKQIDAYDYMQLNVIATDFLLKRPATGAK